MSLTEPRSELDGLNLRDPKTGNPDADSRARTVRVGCAGWNIPRRSASHFKSEGTHLERYSRTFNCCEINSSFYRPHKYSTWERWAAAVPREFQFSVKVPRTITHEARLECEPEDVAAFLKQVSFLGQKLGVLLVQLPPSCSFDPVIAKRSSHSFVSGTTEIPRLRPATKPGSIPE
jgi:uncharacterized protein YecE (DUF72 family)